MDEAELLRAVAEIVFLAVAAAKGLCVKESHGLYGLALYKHAKADRNRDARISAHACPLHNLRDGIHGVVIRNVVVRAKDRIGT